LLFYEKPNNLYISFDEAYQVITSMENMPELIIMEFLPAKEYSVDMLVDHGKVVYCIPRLRQSEISSYDRDYVRTVWLKTFQSFKLNKAIACIAHPFSLFAVMGISIDDKIWWESISKEVSLLPCMLEYNVKYDNTMVPEWFWKKHADKVVTGTDSHSIEDMQIRVNELRLVSDRIYRFLSEE